MAEKGLDGSKGEAVRVEVGGACMAEHVRRALAHRPRQVGRDSHLERQAEGLRRDRATAFGGEEHRTRPLEVVLEASPHLAHPPDEESPRVAEHRHEALPRTRAPRTLAEADVDLAERAVIEVTVVEAKAAELGGAKTRLGGDASHRVGPRRGAPLARRDEPVAPGGEESGELTRRRRDPLYKLAGVDRAVDRVDGRGDDEPGELGDLALVADLEEAVEGGDPPSLHLTRPWRLRRLVAGEEPVGVSGLDLPCPHIGEGEELLHRCEIGPHRRVERAVRRASEDEPREEVLLIDGSVFFRVERVAEYVNRPGGNVMAEVASAAEEIAKFDRLRAGGFVSRDEFKVQKSAVLAAASSGQLTAESLTADELIRLGDLMTRSVITREEFDAQKRDLLWGRRTSDRPPAAVSACSASMRGSGSAIDS